MSEEKKPKRPTRPMPTLRTTLAKGDAETKQRAAVILEVLGGMRSPTSAAESLSISLARYYAMEARAVAGLVEACKPRPHRGRQRSVETQMALLQKEVERLKRECERQQALVRASHRVVGVATPVRHPVAKGKKPRRPIARALTAAEVLHSSVDETATASGAVSMPTIHG